MTRVAIQLVVLNGEKYIRTCLEALKNQTYDKKLVEILMLDNGSIDNTKKIIAEYMPQLSDYARIQLIERHDNIGMWIGQEALLNQSAGEYLVFLSVDVILDNNFIKNFVTAMDADETIGALQAKIYQTGTQTIDTLGFRIERSRRVTNIAQGEIDHGQYEQRQEIFGVEGAAPVFRRRALDDIRLGGTLADPDLFWYAEDLDIAWRLRLAGWKQIYEPAVIARHDRQTSKSTRHNFGDYISRVPARKAIELRRRRLAFRNLHLVIIKNDFGSNLWKDAPWIVAREIGIFGYTFLFEPRVFVALPSLFRLIPKMLTKRRVVLTHARISASEIHSWFR